ncbi:hypothetical protein MKX01_032193, partial [Papaver californicum]
IWPPKSIKDSGSRLHSKLKEAIMQTGMEKHLFGNHPVSLPTPVSRAPPPAFASDPLMGGRDKGHTDTLDSVADGNSTSGVSPATGLGPSKLSTSDIVEIDEPNLLKSTSPG